MPVRLVGWASMPAAFWRHRLPYIDAFLFILILITGNFSGQSYVQVCIQKENFL